MRLSALAFNLCALVVAACLSVFAAQFTVGFVEDRSVVAVQEELIDEGYSWASVAGDGLQIILEGEAPNESDRFRAISTAGGVVDASRVIDSFSVQEAERIQAPEFAVEILRNDSGVSLIGLIPAETDRDDLANRIERIADGKPVTDLLEVADYPQPETWDDALDYALRALGELERSKISVSAKRVSVDAISDSSDQKRLLETRLARNTPDDVSLAVHITAPRPVIAPFTTRFSLEDGNPSFAVCAVDSAEARDKIIAAATELGFEGKSPCVEGLGAPTRAWGEAVSMTMRALSDLGGGTMTVADTEIAVVALEGTDQTTFDRIIGELENALPAVFALQAELPRTEDDADDGPPQFTATLSPEGLLQLRGGVPDEVFNLTVENYAKAKFGAANLTMGTRLTDGLPQGWAVRVLAGVEALSELSNGSVIVEPDTVAVRGKTGNEAASDEINRLLIEKLGETAEFSVEVTYEEQLDPVAGLPTPEECIANIIEVTEARKILFDPGSADLTLDTQPVIDDIAEILKRCPELRIRIAGYTDSQGREVMNQELSQQRASSVLSSLRTRRVPVGRFEAIGFGEADPIADNGTEEGREANRRIEFSLIVPETEEETTTLEELEGAALPDGEPEPTEETSE